MSMRFLFCTVIIALVSGCAETGVPDGRQRAEDAGEYHGTLEPFASEAVYFVVTDRFVDGDSGNNYPDQGRAEGGDELSTFDRPLLENGEEVANIGYMGGDFSGLLQHADYIADTGFTAVWITPIVENPDEAYTGSHPPGTAPFGDQGKTGYHGYWGVNFFEVDEHLESPGLDFGTLVERLRADHDLALVLDIVANHGSPAYTMPEDQPMYGEIYAADGTLVADHENLPPEQLDPDNPLHAFYRREPDLATLGDTNWENPEVLEYFVAAYSQWLDAGVAAFRIDTIRHMPHDFWKQFAARIRQRRPGLFMFGESFSYEAAAIAEHTWAKNGGVSVLDFPMKQAMDEVFAKDAPYSRLADALYLEEGVYENPYELMTFYDNHDMPRMDGDSEDFIDAHNWLFTARGIPVVYYGSEIGFRAGAAEHHGNRDYFGADNVDLARNHPVRLALRRVARFRQSSVALQRGLHLNMGFGTDTAAFFRVYQRAGRSETALVLLNRGDVPTSIDVERMTAAGEWRDLSGAAVSIAATHRRQAFEVPAHGIRVLITDQVVTDPVLETRLDGLHVTARRSR